MIKQELLPINRNEMLDKSYFWLYGLINPEDISQSDINGMAEEWVRYARSVRNVKPNGEENEEMLKRANRFNDVVRQVGGYPDNACIAVLHYWGSLMDSDSRKKFNMDEVSEVPSDEDREIAEAMVKEEYRYPRGM